jgi:hypothetical protein
MTTKRKQISKAVAAGGSATLDDLVMATGLVRKNLHDNIKAALNEFLIERIRDDVTGLPAYKTTAKGRVWLLDKQNDSVTTPAGGGDISPATLDGATSLASVPPGRAKVVIEPPKRDESPVAVRSDESALSKSVTEFCTWVGHRAGVRIPLNLRECKAVIENLKSDGAALTTALEQAETIKIMQDLIASKDDEITELQKMLKGFGPGYQYAIMPDYPDMTIHQSLANARLEAEDLANEGSSPVHVVAIIDTAELAIKWKRAA